MLLCNIYILLQIDFLPSINKEIITKPLLINETQEDDRFVTDEEYDIAIEK